MQVVRVLLVGSALAVVAAGMSHAQSQTVMEKKVLSLDGAKQVIALATAEARRLNAGGAIVIVDDGGYVIAIERLDGTFPAAASVATGKARTAATFRRGTDVFENAIKGGRTSLVAVSEMVPLQGGVPIVVDGSVVGAIGVSGAASAQQDEDIARVAVSAFTPAKVAGSR